MNGHQSGRMRSKSPGLSRSESPERPSWGFGHSKAPSRQEIGRPGEQEEDWDSGHWDRAASRTGRSRTRESRGRSGRSQEHAQNGGRGLGYDEIVNNSSSLLAKPLLSRQNSTLSNGVSSRWREELQTWQANKITIYKNGDQWFEGFELRFRPHKDFQSLEHLLARVSPKIDFTTSVAYLFDTDGNR